jgi:hypothetical protein
MADVVLIGKSGVGKTVLMTVLAKSFERKRDGFTLIPMTHQTSKFVSLNWSIISRGHWPPGTVVGALQELSWQLQIERHPTCHLRLIDFSGHDFTALFAGDRLGGGELEPASQHLPGSLYDLVERIRKSDLVGILVNLSDFIGESDPMKRDENRRTIKFAFDWIRRNHDPERLAIIFTQADQYATTRNKLGTWRAVAAQYLPCVYEAHLADGRIPVVAVSAVQSLKVVADQARTPPRVPDLGSGPSGTLSLLRWINKGAAALDPENRVKLPAAPAKSSKWNGVGKQLLSVVYGFLTLLALAAMGTAIVALDKGCSSSTENVHHK